MVSGIGDVMNFNRSTRFKVRLEDNLRKRLIVRIITIRNLYIMMLYVGESVFKINSVWPPT
jgi:hypothetical protein